MFVRDLKTGRLIDVPNQRVVVPALAGFGLGAYPAGPTQVIYDGLGNPVGVLPFLAALKPLAASLIPTLATKIGGLLKGATGQAASAVPALAPQAVSTMPAAAGAAPSFLSTITNLLPQITSALPMLTGGSGLPQAMPAQSAVPGPEVAPVPPMPPMMPGQTMAPMPMTPSPMLPAVAPPGIPSTGPIQEEVVVAPMRVQTSTGGTVVVPVRIRRRRRLRRRFVRVAPSAMQSVLPRLQFAPRPSVPPHDLQGWHGFSGWRTY
jgi:hypothetical protein